MKRILITGCCGFIGSHLTEKLLSEGYEVTGIDNFDPFYDKQIKVRNLSSFKNHERFKFYEVDLRVPDFYTLFDSTEFSAVIHLAAKAGVQPSLDAAAEYVSANITATTHLLDFMNQAGIKKLLFTSSSSVYGNNQSIPFNEKDSVNEPISPYAFTKRACELQNYAYHHLYNIDIINLRLFTVYGPRQRPDLAIHKFVKLINTGQPIKMFGDGSTSRDYTFVLDTVSGFSAALDYLLHHDNLFEIVNLGNNQPIRLGDLITSIYAEMGKTPQIVTVEEQPGDVKITYADISKAQEMFGYKPTTNLSYGIQQFVKWYHENHG